MFSNLSKGSIIHGIDRTSKMRWFTGSIERITPSINTQYGFSQFPSIDVDIVAIIDGKQREFRALHGSDSVADFGKDSIILADNKDSLYNYVKSLLKISEDAVNEEYIEMHKSLIPQYKDILAEMVPGSTNSSEVKELREQVSSFQDQLSEVLTLLKGGNKSKGA